MSIDDQSLNESALWRAGNRAVDISNSWADDKVSIMESALTAVILFCMVEEIMKGEKSRPTLPSPDRVVDRLEAMMGEEPLSAEQAMEMMNRDSADD